jgi:hypothetical protein
MLACQGWNLAMPEGVARVGHLLLLSEEEFLASLMDPARHGVGRMCYRAAVKVCAPVVAAAGPGSAPAAGVSFNNAPTQTQTFTPTFTPNINIIMPSQSGTAVPASQPKAFSKISREEERPADSQKKQTNIAALFGKPPPSFTGLSDEKILQTVKWVPVESGGHTAGSKLSVFRNKFMADFVRQNPSLVFDKETEKDVRARSLNAYEARGTEVVVETGDASGLWYVGPEKDDIREIEKEMEERPPSQGTVEKVSGGPKELIGSANALDEVAERLRANESAKSAQAKVVAKMKAAKKHEREVDVEGDRRRKTAKFPQEPLSNAAGVENKEAMTEDPQEVEKQGEKRPLADDDGSGSAEIDLVQEAVNPNGNFFTNIRLKVTCCLFFFFFFFCSHCSRHGCGKTVLPLEEISPNWLIELSVL